MCHFCRTLYGCLLYTSRVTFDAKWGVNKRGVPNYETITDPATFYELNYSSIYNADLKGYAAAGDLAKANAYANQAMLSSTYLGYQVYSIPQGQQLIGMDAVSYTHLDVYKRQPITSATRL